MLKRCREDKTISWLTGCKDAYNNFSRGPALLIELWRVTVFLSLRPLLRAALVSYLDCHMIAPFLHYLLSTFTLCLAPNHSRCVDPKVITKASYRQHTTGKKVRSRADPPGVQITLSNWRQRFLPFARNWYIVLWCLHACIRGYI